MAQQQSSSGIIPGAITLFGLGLVWVTVATNFPSQEELSSAALPAETRQAAPTFTSPVHTTHPGLKHSHLSSAAFRGVRVDAGR